MQPSRSGSQFTIYHSELTIPTATAWGLDFFERGRQLDEALDGDEGGTGLRVTPVIEHGDLLHAGDGATRGAGFLCEVLVLEVLARVLLQGNCRQAALLRTIIHQPILADVQVTASGPTAAAHRAALQRRLRSFSTVEKAAMLRRQTLRYFV